MMTEATRPVDPKVGRALLVALLLLHIVLAVTYANLTPYRTPGYLFIARSRPWSRIPDIGAPDERQHANYVIHILSGKGLPVYQVNIPDPAHPGQLTRNPHLDEVYEYHQSPLYYLLDAAYGRLIGLDQAAAEDPARGVRLRYLNALFGAGTALGVYFLGIWGLRRRDVAFLGAAVAALLPMNLALSGAVSNDPLLFCICTWTLAFCALSIREGWTLKRALAVGALVGLGLLTKTTALALLPVVIVAVLLRRPSLRDALASAALAITLVLPWWMRNQRIYGDPLGLRSFQELFAGAPKASAMIDAFGPFTYWTNWVGWWTIRSFIGVFSYMDIFLNERGTSYSGPADDFGPAAPNLLYRFLTALIFVACCGFVGSLLRKQDVGSKRVHVLNGVFLALITLLFVRYNISFYQGQARYFYPAIGPIGLGLAIGALYWARNRTRLVSGCIVVGLVLLNVYALSRLPKEFARRVSPAQSNFLRQ